MDNQKTLVTVANGFVGLSLCKELYSEGCTVSAVVRENAQDNELQQVAIGYSNSWVIKRLMRINLIDKLVLIINIFKFRPKFIDRLGLALSFLVGIKK